MSQTRPGTHLDGWHPDQCGVQGCDDSTFSERPVTFRVEGWPAPLQATLNLCARHTAAALRQADGLAPFAGEAA